MRKWQLGLGVLVVLVLGLSAAAAPAPDSTSSEGPKRRWWHRAAPVKVPPSPNLITRVKSSLIFQLNGNVYPTGAYNVTVLIGQPPKPYFLDPDTGSDLTWLQCDAPCQQCTETPHPLYRPNNDLVVCKDPLCASLHGPGEHKCDDPKQCDYEVEYADGGSSLGVLLNDVFSFQSSTGIPLSPRLAIGCGYDQLPGRSQPFLDGVLGLGRGRSSILTQLHTQGLVRNVVGHCLSSRGGGYLFIGDELYDPADVVWSQMPRDSKHYSAGSAELTYGDRSTGFRNLPIIFDSGSSYTYFSSPVYQAVSYLMKNSMVGKPIYETFDDVTLPLCWMGKKPFRHLREVKKFFRPILLHFQPFGRSRVKFDIPPESYLIISPLGNVCLGILNGTESGLQNYNVIGDISMQDRLVIYDNERDMIGWTPESCHLMPRSAVMINK